MPIKYVLFGVTGTVGKALAANLAKRGQISRVVGRSEERLLREFGRHKGRAQYCVADFE